MSLRGLALAQLRPNDLAPGGPKGAPCPGRPSGTRRGRGPPRGRRRRQGPANDVQAPPGEQPDRGRRRGDQGGERQERDKGPADEGEPAVPDAASQPASEVREERPAAVGECRGEAELPNGLVQRDDGKATSGAPLSLSGSRERNRPTYGWPRSQPFALAIDSGTGRREDMNV